MIDLYYIVPIKQIKKNLVGVEFKINSQIKILSQYGINCKIIDVTKESKNFMSKIYNRLPFTETFGEWNKMNKLSYSGVIYIRHQKVDYQFIRQIKKLKQNNKNIKIIMEIPTYPYEKESKRNLIGIPHDMKDRINRKKLYKYIDRIVTYSDDKQIFNIPTINISNGIDTTKIKALIPIKHDGINVIAVASFARWHGYDRFIKGLSSYYLDNPKQNITLHLVGDGEEVEFYKQLVERYKIQDKVIFYGRKTGQGLDEIYNKCDIALDAMGRHRSGVYYNSTLKGKEYAAKGIPSISGVTTELDSDKEFRYYLRVPADESEIDMEKVIEFYKEVYLQKDQSEIVKEIRAYAEKKFNINVCLKPVVDYIKGEMR